MNPFCFEKKLRKIFFITVEYIYTCMDYYAIKYNAIKTFRLNITFIIKYNIMLCRGLSEG